MEPLRFVNIPTEDAALSQEMLAPMIDYLSKELGREVELLTVSDFAAAVEAMKYNHADFGRFGAFSYVLATQEADVEAIVGDIKKSTGTLSYQSLIIARADSNVTDLNGKSFAFLDVASTSGHLIPATYIKKHGIELGETFFAGTHNAVIQAIKNGTVDAGAVSDSRFLLALDEGLIEEGELVVLWTSDPIPSPPIVVQASLDSALKDEIRQAFLNMPLEIVEGLNWKAIGFAEMNDSDFDVIREVQETLGLD